MNKEKENRIIQKAIEHKLLTPEEVHEAEKVLYVEAPTLDSGSTVSKLAFLLKRKLITTEQIEDIVAEIGHEDGLLKCYACGEPHKKDSSSCSKCGAAFPHPEDLIETLHQIHTDSSDINQVLKSGQFFSPRYQIIEEIGRGGMGCVYKAIDKEINQVVVLKVIRNELTADPAIVARFKRELLLAREITHENVLFGFMILVM